LDDGWRGANCVAMPNLVEIGQSAAEIWRFFDFSRWRPPPCWIFKIWNFERSDGSRGPNCIALPNLAEIGQNRCWDMTIFRFFQDIGIPASWICYVCVRTVHKGYLVVFIAVQNLVGIRDVHGNGIPIPMHISNSNQILHSDKDNQMVFVGGPNTHITNPRWRTAAILEKSKNHHISATVWPISTKFGMVTQFDALDRSHR